MLSNALDQLHDLLVRARVLVLVVAALCGAAGAVYGSGIPLDMSFRPLFTEDEELLARTKRFEATFGEVSGAWIGVVLESEATLTKPFLEELGQLTKEVEALPHVVDVISLTQPLAPSWERTLVAKPHVLEQGGDPVAVLKELQRTHEPFLRALLTSDGKTSVLYARLDLPLEDLEGRAPVIRAFRDVVEAHAPAGASTHLVGISVVEEAYARLLTKSLFVTVGLTSAVICLLLLLLYGTWRAVVVVMAGTALASPLTLAAMRAQGDALTLVNGMVLVVVLVIAVGDAIHMLDAFLEERHAGTAANPAKDAFRRLFSACLLTSVTTSAGFLSLLAADLPAIRGFGVHVATGVALAFLLNQALVPALLSLLPPADGRGLGRHVDTLAGKLADVVTTAPRRGIVVVTALIVGLLAAVPLLDVDQRFNEDVPATHPVRAAQALLEERFTGVLGPEVAVRRRDGHPLLTREDLAALARFTKAIEAHDDVRTVQSVLDLDFTALPEDLWSMTLDQLRAHEDLRFLVGSVVSPRYDELAVIVRIRDVGTSASARFVEHVERTARETLGPAYEVEVVGPWWLAQQGMGSLLDDMLASFLMSCLVVLPFLWLAARKKRLFLLGVAANVVPVLCALGLMAALGISLRIGTAMVLALALGIAVDDTLHLLARLRHEEQRGAAPREAAKEALTHTGRSLVVTTCVLAVGFLSMTTSELLALRDMGLIAAGTLVLALLVDVFVLTGLYALTRRSSVQSATRCGGR